MVLILGVIQIIFQSIAVFYFVDEVHKWKNPHSAIFIVVALVFMLFRRFTALASYFDVSWIAHVHLFDKFFIPTAISFFLALAGYFLKYLKHE